MAFKNLIAKNFRKPQGLFGLLAKAFMDKFNRSHVDHVVQSLELKDDDRILEVGFGAGHAIARICRQNRLCQVAGLDFSALMVNNARKLNKHEINRGRVFLECGDCRTFDFGERKFSKIFAINVIYFWEDLQQVLAKLYALLVPSGRLTLFMSSKKRLNSSPFALDTVFNKYSLEDVVSALEQAEFRTVRHATIEMDGLPMYHITAEK